MLQEGNRQPNTGTSKVVFFFFFPFATVKKILQKRTLLKKTTSVVKFFKSVSPQKKEVFLWKNFKNSLLHITPPSK